MTEPAIEELAPNFGDDAPPSDPDGSDDAELFGSFQEETADALAGWRKEQEEEREAKRQKLIACGVGHPDPTLAGPDIAEVAGPAELAEPRACVAAPAEAGNPVQRYGSWQVLPIPGGALHYSETLGKINVHCGNDAHHSKSKCKMDRSFMHAGKRQRPLGLLLCWLAHHRTPSAGEKNEYKERYDLRASCRRDFMDFVATLRGEELRGEELRLAQKILDTERIQDPTLDGVDGEPLRAV